MPRWGVVLLAREPQALVLANLAWHRALGAEAIHLYLDDPDDPVAGPAAAIPGVRVTRCDPAFWRGLGGGRPGLQTRRQSLVATQAYRRGGLDWLVHLDADEFLWCERPLAEELAENAGHQGYLALTNLERAFIRTRPESIFEGVFRIPLAPDAPLPPHLEPETPFLSRGLPGHAAGKACVRTGLNVTLQPHAPRDRDGGRVPMRRARGALVLHFDGLTPLHWLIKLRHYAKHDVTQRARFLAPHRRAQIDLALAHAGDPMALRAFHDRLKCCPDHTAHAVGRHVARLDFDPSPALAAFCVTPPALDVASFDATLRKRFPDLAAGL